MFVFPGGTSVLLKMHFSVRTVFLSECILNIFNIVISGMKTQFYTSKYGRIENTNIKLFYSVL